MKCLLKVFGLPSLILAIGFVSAPNSAFVVVEADPANEIRFDWKHGRNQWAG